MCPVPLHMKFDCPLPELNCHINVTMGGDHGGTVEARSPFVCVVYLNALSSMIFSNVTICPEVLLC